MDDAMIQSAAKRLLEAEQQCAPIRQLSHEHPAMTIEHAYAVQRAWSAMKLDAGRTVRGHKIGLTSRAMQQSVMIDEPDYGVLFDDMMYGDGSEIPHARFIEPRIEVELAFVLDAPLRGPGCTVFDVLRATAFVTPALELIDARIERLDRETGRARTVMDTIADNAANAGVILGGRAIRPLDVDLRWVSALLYRNGIIEESGVAAAVLNHPANGVAWLANKLAAYDVELEPDHVVLAGSFTRPVSVAAGDNFHVDYGALGSITCRFA